MIEGPMEEARKALIAEFEAMPSNAERADRAMQLVEDAMDWGYSHGIAAGLESAMRLVGPDGTMVAEFKLEPDDPLALHLQLVAEAEAAAAAGAGDDDDDE